MKILLDTNAFFRWTRGDQVPRNVERIISSPKSNLLVSIVTPWEIALKQTRWREKSLNQPRISEAIDLLNARLLPILLSHVEALYTLPPHHADPFDRMLIAQAITEKAAIVSSDERFPLYRSAGLQVIWK